MSVKQSPFDFSRLVVTVKQSHGAALECQGTPCNAPDEIDISIQGTVRVNFQYDRTECTTCSSWDGMRCKDGFDEDEIQACLLDTIEAAKPISIPLDEINARLFINALGFTEIHGSYAIAEVLDAEVRS